MNKILVGLGVCLLIGGFLIVHSIYSKVMWVMGALSIISGIAKYFVRFFTPKV